VTLAGAPQKIDFGGMSAAKWYVKNWSGGDIYCCFQPETVSDDDVNVSWTPCVADADGVAKLAADMWEEYYEWSPAPLKVWKHQNHIWVSGTGKVEVRLK